MNLFEFRTLDLAWRRTQLGCNCLVDCWPFTPKIFIKARNVSKEVEEKN